MDTKISVTLMLKSSSRTPEAAARVQEMAAGLGLELTTAGKSSLSFRADPETFTRLFGVTATPVEPRPPGERDFGAPGGHIVEEELKVPDELAEFVESVSVLPPATRFGR
jgi:hypothetical protein